MEAKAPRPDWLMGDLMLRVAVCQGMAPLGNQVDTHSWNVILHVVERPGCAIELTK